MFFEVGRIINTTLRSVRRFALPHDILVGDCKSPTAWHRPLVRIINPRNIVVGDGTSPTARGSCLDNMFFEVGRIANSLQQGLLTSAPYLTLCISTTLKRSVV